MARETIKGWKAVAEGFEDMACQWEAAATSWRSRCSDLTRRNRRWKAGFCASLLACVLLSCWGFRSLTPSSLSDTPISSTPHLDMPLAANPKNMLDLPVVQASVKMVSSGKPYICSATVIAQSDAGSVIVGAAHCVAGNIGGEAKFETVDGKRFAATLIAFDNTMDVALFSGPPNPVKAVACVPETLPKSVAKWEAVGFSSGGSVQHKDISPWTTWRCKDCSATHQGFKVTDHDRFSGGDSGGGIFADGSLIGVIRGTVGSDRWLRTRNGTVENLYHGRMDTNCPHADLVAFLKKHSPAMKLAPFT